MFRSIHVLLLLSICFVPNKSDFNLHCPNGRQALWTFDISTFLISAGCSAPGQSCNNKIGICSEQNLCCPRTLK